MIVLTAASVLFAMEPLSRLGAADQSWFRMEQDFLVITFVVLVITTLLLWSRVRWVLVPSIGSARGLWLLLGVAHHRHDSQWELLGTTGPDVPGLHGALSFSRCALSGDLGQELFPSRIILQMLCHTNSPCP